MVTTTLNHSRDLGEKKYLLESNSILAECCERPATCRLQLIHFGHSVTATFVSLDEELVQIQAPSHEGDTRLTPYAIGCVTFPYGTSNCAFLGCLMDVQRDVSGELRVLITYPEELMVANLRQSFRVPVIENSGLETTVRTWDKHQFAVVTCNITESGLDVLFPADNDPGLNVGSMLSVELKYRGQIIRRSAVVRRVAENHYGIEFTRERDDHSQRQASSMHGMVLSLQQAWLRSRLG